MGTNCAPLVADLFLYCYERDFMDSLNHDNQADVIEAFNSTSRYLDDLLNIDNPYFEGMVNQIYPSELQFNKANISDTEAPFLDLHLSVANGSVSSKIYDKRDDFDFDIVNFPFLDGDVPRRASYGTSRQRSGKGAIRKRFPLQKPRWEKTKPTIRYLYHETYRKPNEQLFSQ